MEDIIQFPQEGIDSDKGFLPLIAFQKSRCCVAVSCCNLPVKRFVCRSTLLSSVSTLDQVVSDSLEGGDNDENALAFGRFKNDVRNSVNPLRVRDRRSPKFHNVQ